MQSSSTFFSLSPDNQITDNNIFIDEQKIKLLELDIDRIISHHKNIIISHQSLNLLFQSKEWPLSALIDQE